MSKKVLILGGTGAMGVSLSKILADKGIDVYITTRSDFKSIGNIHYIKGNAHNNSFISEILKVKYDYIVDFMNYQISELTDERISILLTNTEHYIFLSSSRVYGNSETPITENTQRLLDCSIDEVFLATNEYSLSKAREENFLRAFPQKNWTIIRPYITYNTERLQLGVLEKEQWLYRALKGRTIVFFKDIGEHFTTMTYGYDLANILALILDKKESFGETYHITTSECLRWNDILEVYKEILERKLGKEIRIKWINKASQLKSLEGNKYQIKYCRLFDRRFDNSKVMNLVGTDYKFIPTKEGLKKCLEQFIDEHRPFRNISWAQQAEFDKITKEFTPLSEINGLRNKVTYLLYRLIPFERIRPLLARLKHRLVG